MNECAEKPTSPKAVCHEVSSELKDIAGWLADGDLTPEEFRKAIAAVEEKKLRRHGLGLSSAVSENRIVHFSLRYAASGEQCASIAVDLASGEVAIETLCQDSPKRPPTFSTAWLWAPDLPGPPPPSSLFVIGVARDHGKWNGYDLVLAETCSDGSLQDIATGRALEFLWSDVDWWYPLELGGAPPLTEPHFGKAEPTL